MKPSEKFLALKTAAEALEEGQDKSDLLALFQMADDLHDRADKLHDRVETFDRTVEYLKRVSREQQEALEEELKGFRKWKPLLEYFAKKKKEETIVSLTRARESDSSI